MITYLRAYGNHTNQIYEFVLGLLLSEKLKTKYRPLFVKELFPYYPEIKKIRKLTCTPRVGNQLWGYFYD